MGVPANEQELFQHELAAKNHATHVRCSKTGDNPNLDTWKCRMTPEHANGVEVEIELIGEGLGKSYRVSQCHQVKGDPVTQAVRQLCRTIR
jgi:hypothetical protein